jgi:hypothetical protein
LTFKHLLFLYYLYYKQLLNDLRLLFDFSLQETYVFPFPFAMRLSNLLFRSILDLKSMMIYLFLSSFKVTIIPGYEVTGFLMGYCLLF